ncbi:MAG TPA: hypothetical protein VFS77_21695 [Pyrinomonadaceae bacterium]|nr:hypothetical protein [Pyrinomonadaceae bacterium]
MTVTSKSIVISALAISALLAALVVVFVRGAVSQRGTTSYEGYFAPVYSPDGQHVYFVERRTTGTARETKGTDLFFSAPEFDVSVETDTFSLKRLHVESGQVEELTRLPASPIEGRRYEKTKSPFQMADARLQFTKERQLEFNVCLTADEPPRLQEYMSSGVWSEAQHAGKISRAWEKLHCEVSGYDEWPLFGDWELREVRGRLMFPAAIVAYNHVTNAVKVLVKNKEYDRLYPDGPLRQILEYPRRADMERTQTVRRVHEELLQKYKAMGMGEMQALLRVGKDMQRLGYYPKTTMIVARRLDRAEAGAGKLDKEALFSVAKDEMASGVFPDIEEAIARPGEEIDKSSEYHIHRDYSTSARLNKFIKTGKTRFYVAYLGETYELTIIRP